jgi:hypothetical protein
MGPASGLRLVALDVVLFYGSLGIAFAAVLLFLFLMRRSGNGQGGPPPR